MDECTATRNGDSYALLAGMIRVLVVDDDHDCASIYERMRVQFPVFWLRLLHSAKEAADYAASWRPQVCICELQLRDRVDLALLRVLACRTRIIVVTKCASAEVGAMAKGRGAYAVLDKAAPTLPKKLPKLLTEAFLRSIFDLGDEHPASRIGRISKILHDQPPTSVGKWAANARVSEGYLRELCAQRIGLPPRRILQIAHTFHAAHEYYEHGRPSGLAYDRTCSEDFLRLVARHIAGIHAKSP